MVIEMDEKTKERDMHDLTLKTRGEYENTDVFKFWAEAMATDCASAKKSITLSALSLHAPAKPLNTPFGRLWQSWIDAAERGVNVELYLPAPTKIHPATLQNRQHGIRAAANGITVHFVPQPELLHAKSCVIDSAIAWVGSGNFTSAAAHHNHELYLRCADARIAQDVEGLIKALPKGWLPKE